MGCWVSAYKLHSSCEAEWFLPVTSTLSFYTPTLRAPLATMRKLIFQRREDMAKTKPGVKGISDFQMSLGIVLGNRHIGIMLFLIVATGHTSEKYTLPEKSTS